MKAGTPFRAASLLAAAVAALMQATAGNFAAQQAGLSALGPYKGRGKGKTRNHDNGGTRAYQRAATKARNVKRHRAHCRGAHA